MIGLSFILVYFKAGVAEIICLSLATDLFSVVLDWICGLLFNGERALVRRRELTLFCCTCSLFGSKYSLV